MKLFTTLSALIFAATLMLPASAAQDTQRTGVFRLAPAIDCSQMYETAGIDPTDLPANAPLKALVGPQDVGTMYAVATVTEFINQGADDLTDSVLDAANQDVEYCLKALVSKPA